MSTADYEKSLSELEIEDEDCLQVRDWNLFSTKFFHCQNLISCFSSIQPPGISAPKQRLWIPVSSKVVCLSSIFYLIFDGDVIPTAPYKNTISELDIDDQDCLEVHRWKYLHTDSHDMRIVHDGKSFQCHIPVFSSIQPRELAVRGYLHLQKHAKGEFPGNSMKSLEIFC